jgi:hypothetical protein
MSNSRIFRQIAQCDKKFDFQPSSTWPKALPVYCWKGIQLNAWSRQDEFAIDLFELNGSNFHDSVYAAYPTAGLAELARMHSVLQEYFLALLIDTAEPLFSLYSLRWCERLQMTLKALVQTDRAFQDWVDQKRVGTRELSPLLAVPNIKAFDPILVHLIKLNGTKTQVLQALELMTELNLMGHDLSDVAPTENNLSSYIERLEKWRRPLTSKSDEGWREQVSRWPWPAQVQGQWLRFGDQAGLEIKMRTTSPQDFHKKLERLLSIRESWLEQPKD